VQGKSGASADAGLDVESQGALDATLADEGGFDDAPSEAQSPSEDAGLE
jgi:hypothetical protein